MEKSIAGSKGPKGAQGELDGHLKALGYTAGGLRFWAYFCCAAIALSALGVARLVDEPERVGLHREAEALEREVVGVEAERVLDLNGELLDRQTRRRSPTIAGSPPNGRSARSRAGGARGNDDDARAERSGRARRLQCVRSRSARAPSTAPTAAPSVPACATRPAAAADAHATARISYGVQRQVRHPQCLICAAVSSW